MTDIDALIARIEALADCAYWAIAGWDIPGDATQKIGLLAVKAAAALKQQQELLKQQQEDVNTHHNAGIKWSERALAAEAERDALRVDVAKAWADGAEYAAMICDSYAIQIHDTYYKAGSKVCGTAIRAAIDAARGNHD
jgi:hypothetical protein